MASGKVIVNASNAVRGMTLEVKISGCKPLAFRLRIASILIRFAARIGGFNVEFIE